MFVSHWSYFMMSDLLTSIYHGNCIHINLIFSRKRAASSSCLFNAGLAHNCDYRDVIGAVNEVNHWGSGETVHHFWSQKCEVIKTPGFRFGSWAQEARKPRWTLRLQPLQPSGQEKLGPLPWWRTNLESENSIYYVRLTMWILRRLADIIFMASRKVFVKLANSFNWFLWG